MPIGLGHSGTDKATKFGAVSDYVVAGYVPTAADFVAEAYFDAGVADTFAGLLTFTRASSATYVDAAGVLQTATTDTPRFTYDPSTGEKLGLMREPAATNLALYSDDLALGGTPVAATVSANAGDAPDGTATADKLVENTANAEHYLSCGAVNYVSGTTYVHSVLVKPDGRPGLRILAPAAAYGANKVITFDLENLTALEWGGSFDFEDYGIELGPNGYVLCWARATATATATATAMLLNLDDDPSDTKTSYTGDGVSGMFIAGIQVEAGQYPSSRIVTTGAAATRAAETIQIPAANLPTPPSGGAWVIQMDGVLSYADTGANAVARPWLRFGTDRFYVELNTGGANVGQLQFVGGVGASLTSTASDVLTPGVNVPFNIAGLYSADRTLGAYDGNLLTPVVHSNGIPTFTTEPLQIMPNGNAIIKKIRIFTEYVSDAVLAEMTT